LCLGVAAATAGLSTVFQWRVDTGGDAPPGFIRFVAHGFQVAPGRWLIALALTALVWVVLYLLNRDSFVALTAIAIAAAGLGVSIWAVSDFGADAWEPLVASTAWLALALLVAGTQWGADGRPRPVVVEVFRDFRFSHFLTTSFVGFLWSLAIAASVTSIFGAAIEYFHRESVLFGLLVAVIAFVFALIWLLVVRLFLEAIVVLFRIYDELRASNTQESGAMAPGE
jgi:Domain of unknown function (DUF4282)